MSRRSAVRLLQPGGRREGGRERRRREGESVGGECGGRVWGEMSANHLLFDIVVVST